MHKALYRYRRTPAGREGAAESRRGRWPKDSGIISDGNNYRCGRAYREARAEAQNRLYNLEVGRLGDFAGRSE